MRRLTILLLAVLSMWGAPLFAAPPQTINYQGYLASSGGTPVNATVPMVFKLWDAASGGNLLWTETQSSVAVTSGVFNVVLGSVTLNPLDLAFDAPYFLGVAAGVDAEMTPRQALTASPYAFRAKAADTATSATTVTGPVSGSQVTGPISVAAVIESTSGGVKYPDGKTQTKALANCSAEGDVAVVQAGAWVCKSLPPRYVDNGNGTVTDNQTGLMWEKKLASTDGACLDANQANRNVRCVQNSYIWSGSGSAPDGALYTDFLAKLNLNTSGDGNTFCFASYCDWRIPTIGELRSILLTPYPCGTNPCIDAIFGSTQASYYWSSSSLAGFSNIAWNVFFNEGLVDFNFKYNNLFARAVRSGR